jgi:hypothetical protein
MNYIGGARCCYVILFFNFLILTNHGYGRQKSDHWNSLEFSPQVSLALFTAGNKLSGSTLGGEFTYHIQKNDHPGPWMRMLNLNSIDLVLNYKNMKKVVLASDPRPNLFWRCLCYGDCIEFHIAKNLSMPNCGLHRDWG